VTDSAPPGHPYRTPPALEALTKADPAKVDAAKVLDQLAEIRKYLALGHFDHWPREALADVVHAFVRIQDRFAIESKDGEHNNTWVAASALAIALAVIAMIGATRESALVAVIALPIIINRYLAAGRARRLDVVATRCGEVAAEFRAIAETAPLGVKPRESTERTGLRVDAQPASRSPEDLPPQGSGSTVGRERKKR
jgi:hypothetical protein